MSIPTEIAVSRSAKIVRRVVAAHEATSKRWAFIKLGNFVPHRHAEEA